MSIEFAEKSNLFSFPNTEKQEAYNKPADEYICEIKFERISVFIEEANEIDDILSNSFLKQE